MSTHPAARFIDDDDDVVIRFDDEAEMPSPHVAGRAAAPARPTFVSPGRAGAHPHAHPHSHPQPQLHPLPPAGAADEPQDPDEEMEQLRHRQELLQRQKQEMEEMHRRREGYENARTEAEAQLQGYVHSLEKEIVEAKKWATDCSDLREVLDHHLRTVRSQRPEAWQRHEQRERIIHALREIDAARSEVVNGGEILKRLQKGRGGKVSAILPMRPALEESDFMVWFKRGVAFTLPIILFATVALAISALFV